MTAVTTTVTHQSPAARQANQWLEQNHAELLSRACANTYGRDAERRDEVVAEILAMSVGAVHSAARRNVLDHVTPFWAVKFATRQISEGRRFAGTNSKCVMSEAAKVRRGIRLVSLDQEAHHSNGSSPAMANELPGKDNTDPFDCVRRANDYVDIFKTESVSAKAKKVFQFLVETNGTGKQIDLAAELMVSPGRITQLKQQLADALARHDYTGPLGPRPRHDRNGHRQCRPASQNNTTLNPAHLHQESNPYERKKEAQ